MVQCIWSTRIYFKTFDNTNDGAYFTSHVLGQPVTKLSAFRFFLSLIIAFRFVKFAYTDFYEALHLFIVRLEYMLLNSVSIK